MIKNLVLFLAVITSTNGIAQDFYQLQVTLPSEFKNQIHWKYLNKGQTLVSAVIDGHNSLRKALYSKAQTNLQCENITLYFDLETHKKYNTTLSGFAFLPLRKNINTNEEESTITVTHGGNSIGKIPTDNLVKILSKKPQNLRNLQVFEQEKQKYLVLQGSVILYSQEQVSTCK